MAKKVSYKDAGVDIDAGDLLVENLKKINPSIGGFGGFLRVPKGYKEPQFVLSTDGVGTKLLVAQELGIYHTIGIDLVAMVVNDILATGARPLSFLDYFAVEHLDATMAGEVLRGIVEGCRIAGCELVGGETAELPGIYPKDGFDLAGFGVGVVERREVIDGSGIKDGQVIIGLPSSGIHSNGYSLARRVLLDGKPKPKGEQRRAILEQMLIPTAIYVTPVLKLLRKIKVRGIAHITGGGLGGNIVRILPDGVQAHIDPTTWEVPPIFEMIEQRGPVDRAEMFRVFNMGIGLALIVSAKDAELAVKTLRRSMIHAVQIGQIGRGPTKAIIDGVLEETP
jgi:phosphoribosylformylglycinamidine cyclo-ligase